MARWDPWRRSLTRALGVAESDPLGHARRALFSRHDKNRVSLRLLGTAFMGPAATRRATTNDDNDEYVYRTDRHFRLHPRDASGRVGCGERRVRQHRSREGPDPRARGVDSTEIFAQLRRRTFHGVANDRSRRQPPPRASTPPAPADRARSGAGANRASGATRRRRTAIGSVGLFASPSTSGANP